MVNCKDTRKDFPMLDGKTLMHGKPLIYFDNGATTLKPQCVIDAVCEYLSSYSGNAHRGDYDLSHQVDVAYEEAREAVQHFIHAKRKEEVVFTSGSTGIPKGVVVNHNSVMHYLNWFTNEFNINETTVFGNQTPLYFSMSISDVLGTIYAGSTLYFIPHSYFSFPLYLMKYMEENKINTIYWVPSALNMISTFDAFKSFELPELKKVLFAGEVMPPKVINYFVRNHKAYYANLFGPTETTDICTYYEIKEETDNVPIGKACNGLTAIILKDGKESQTGELYIKGPFLASGYYNNPQKTSEVFIQNPLNKAFPEIIYKTGDIVNVREDGNLLYVGRADFQIKHMGYRIELGEIENKVYEIDEVNTCVVVYKNDKIILYYVGNIEEETLLERLKAKVPNYMIPNKIHKESKMNYNLNGKIDRTFYKNLKEDE